MSFLVDVLSNAFLLSILKSPTRSFGFTSDIHISLIIRHFSSSSHFFFHLVFTASTQYLGEITGLSQGVRFTRALMYVYMCVRVTNSISYKVCTFGVCGTRIRKFHAIKNRAGRVKKKKTLQNMKTCTHRPTWERVTRLYVNPERDKIFSNGQRVCLGDLQRHIYCYYLRDFFFLDILFDHISLFLKAKILRPQYKDRVFLIL